MRVLIFAVVLLASTQVLAQSPYSGLQGRPIKALSEQQVADLANGRGMGLALAAELNGYPGPLHLLELADRLTLTPDQRARIQDLFDAMKREAIPLGTALIEQEAELDRLFATRQISADALKTLTASIGARQGELRDAHLKYHLAAAALLTPQQIESYAELRGYRGGAQHAPRRHGH